MECYANRRRRGEIYPNTYNILLFLIDHLLYLCYTLLIRTQNYHIVEISMSEFTIYNRLPVLRAERGMSRQALANALGINYQTVGYLERGEYNPSLELAFRFSKFFALPIEAIFSTRPFKPLSEEVYARR